MSQYAHLSDPDPEIVALTARCWRGNITVLARMLNAIIPISVTRKIFTLVIMPRIMDRIKPNLPPESAYRVEDHTVAVEKGKIQVRCLTPTPAGEEQETFPLLLWLHGGWVMGNIDWTDFYLRTICVGLQVSIVNVDYRLAPEHPFPTGLNDCYAALKWAATNASLLSASLAQGFIVGGTSAGANFAAVIVHRALTDHFFADKKITGHALQVPPVVHPEGYPDKYKSELLSMEQNKDAPMLNRKQHLKSCKDLQAPPFDRDFSPLLFPHHDLPPLYIQVCGMDPLRDEGLLYEKVVREAGVPTKLDVYPGVPHAFQALYPNIKAAARFDMDLREGLQWLLSKPV